MTRRVLLMTALVLVLSLSLASAAVFNNPPETSGIIPPGGWVYDFPYQQNRMIDFASDPNTWPDATPPEQGKDLLPGVNYDIEGLLDPELYPTDWFDPAGDLVWLAEFDGRTGLIGIDGENQQGQLVWHMDDRPHPEPFKHIWVEWGYYLSGTGGWGVAVVPEDKSEVVETRSNTEDLGGGWWQGNLWYDIIPNPPWEYITITMATDPTTPGQVYVDYMHAAAECVPEPGTTVLFGLGLIGLAMWRRRKAA